VSEIPRRQLQEALARVSEEYALLITDPRAEIELIPNSFLNDYHIVQIERFTPKKYTLLYIGFSAGRALYPLTGAPDNYLQLAQEDNVTITSPTLAREYAETYLKVTSKPKELFYQVSLVSDVIFRPNLDEEETGMKADFVDMYQSEINPPEVNPVGDDYCILVYAIREQALEKHEINISSKGDIKHTIVVLEEDLPLVYGGLV
jgi:hypothetical protein